MAISQNDPENWPHNVSLYDPEARGKTLNRTVFEWITVTRDRVWPGDSYGLKFMDNPPCKHCEDEKKKDEKFQQCERGSIWNIFGTWNDAIGRSDPYAGTQYVAGQKVDVQLQLSEKQQADGSTKYQRSIPKHRMNAEFVAEQRENTPEPATPEPVAPEPVAAAPTSAPKEDTPEPILTTDQRIAKAQAINIIKDLLIAGLTKEIGLTEEAAWVILRDETIRLAQGKAVDLSYVTPVVQAAVENGGTIADVTPSDDEVITEFKWDK